MSAYVYFIGSGAGPIKIGRAKNPWARLREFQTAHHEPLQLLGVFLVADARRFERALHQALAPWRVGGEWFYEGAAIWPLQFGLDHADEDHSLTDEEQLAATLIAGCAPPVEA